MGLLVLILVLGGIAFAIWKLRSDSKKNDSKVSSSGGGSGGGDEGDQSHDK